MVRIKKWHLALFAVLAVMIAFSPAQAGESDGKENALNNPYRREQIVMFREGTPKEERLRTLKQKGAEIVKELPLIDGYLVKFKKFTPNAVMMLKAAPSVVNVELDRYHKWLNVAAPALPSVGAALKGAREGATALPSILGEEKAEPEKRSELPWGVERVGASKVWNRTTGKGVKVAVIDTGIDMEHPDLAANIKGGYNSVDPEASAQDDQGHGTHVAGTIAAVPNGKGVIGVAPHASLYAVKVLDADGGGTFATIIGGLNWCVENGMHIANMSLGGPSSPAMEKAVRAAYDAGLVIVAASGNSGPDASVSAPASYPWTIAVTASTPEDGIAEFSSVGKEVDVIAPGHKVLSTWPDSRLAELSGTSMASPHVAGLAALAYQSGATSPDRIKSLLKRSAQPLEGLDENQQGAGMPKADRWFN
jgi:subtilisin family serine protease